MLSPCLILAIGGISHEHSSFPSALAHPSAFWYCGRAPLTLRSRRANASCSSNSPRSLRSNRGLRPPEARRFNLSTSSCFGFLLRNQSTVPAITVRAFLPTSAHPQTVRSWSLVWAACFSCPRPRDNRRTARLRRWARRAPHRRRGGPAAAMFRGNFVRQIYPRSRQSLREWQFSDEESLIERGCSAPSVTTASSPCCVAARVAPSRRRPNTRTLQPRCRATPRIG